ncbi:MAG: FGGY family carbohydrate kinase, partial [Verrucomicrobiota bacterium]
MSGVFIGVDSGTQGTKAVAINGKTGAVLAEHSVSYGLIQGLPEGAKEQDPKTWTKALDKCIKSMLLAGNADRLNGRCFHLSGSQNGF